ncbi:anti-sigma factor family protein [Rhodoblastus sp.]|uniref:anti-sigma factor family protein n=1 Tax=Rhodoblastus sp. TaxID=1962975 RepID=UPI003F951C31
MSAAEEKILKLQAALDGELDAAGMLDFERACAADPALAAEFARAKALDAALLRALPAEAAPEVLRARIVALAAAPPARRTRIFSAPWSAMAASLLVGVLAGYGAFSSRGTAPSEDRALVSAFMRTQIGGQSVDIASSDRHTVKPWLAGRAPLSVAALDLASAGFPLAGGRVEAIDGKIVPTLVYRRREHRIDVTELALTGGGDERVRLSRLDGYHLAHWSDSDRAYVAVTDLPESELADFVALFRAAANGEREEVKKPAP